MGAEATQPSQLDADELDVGGRRGLQDGLVERAGNGGDVTRQPLLFGTEPADTFGESSLLDLGRVEAASYPFELGAQRVKLLLRLGASVEESHDAPINLPD